MMNASALNNRGNIGATTDALQVTTTGNLTNSGTLVGDAAAVSLNVGGDVDNSGNIISNEKMSPSLPAVNPSRTGAKSREKRYPDRVQRRCDA